MITSDWSLAPGDPRSSFTSEVSFASYTGDDVRPMRLAMLAQWPQREEADIAHLPEDAQVAAYYLFCQYKAGARKPLSEPPVDPQNGQFARWTRLLAHYSSEARLGLTLSHLKALAAKSLVGS